MHARQQGDVPQRDDTDQVGPQGHYTQAVESQQHGDDAGGAGQRQQVDRRGVKHRDDRHRAHVVDDRHRDQHHFQRQRRMLAEQRQGADGKGDVGGGGNRPATGQPGFAAGDGQVDQCGHGHAHQRRQGRQAALLPAGQAAVDQLALDLQAHQQEEDRHQAVVDPHVHGHRAELVGQHRADRQVQQVLVGAGPGAVGDDDGQGGGEHQQYAASRFGGQQLAQHRRLLERVEGCIHVAVLVHDVAPAQTVTRRATGTAKPWLHAAWTIVRKGEQKDGKRGATTHAVQARAGKGHGEWRHACNMDGSHGKQMNVLRIREGLPGARSTRQAAILTMRTKGCVVILRPNVARRACHPGRGHVASWPRRWHSSLNRLSADDAYATPIEGRVGVCLSLHGGLSDL